jgi:phosphatidylserine decarboxylase
MANKEPILFMDRKTGEICTEIVMGEKWIRWAYQDATSPWIEKLLFGSSLISRLMGLYYDSPLSKAKIRPAIEALAIDEADFARPTESFKSFNDFFIRQLKPEARPYCVSPETILSPADGRALVFPRLEEGTYAPVKGYPFSLEALLGDLAAPYRGGALAIVRLCPADYHRYHYPASGYITDYRAIKGAYHSVNPIALGSGPDVFALNKRHITEIQTEKAGRIAFIEVGAFGVGSIVNHRRKGPVKAMEEKGYFKFGGSTVVLVFEPDTITFSDDLLTNSAKGIETLVKVGEEIGRVGE